MCYSDINCSAWWDIATFATLDLSKKIQSIFQGLCFIYAALQVDRKDQIFLYLVTYYLFKQRKK